MSAGTTRRQLFEASAALLLVGLAGAGEAKARELDRELLDACAGFEDAERQVEASNALEDVSDTDWARLIDGPGIAWQDALDRLCDCPAPRTPEAVQRKAQAALAALRRFHAELVPGEITLALSALEDVAGEARA